jgi:hypothetical protein
VQESIGAIVEGTGEAGRSASAQADEGVAEEVGLQLPGSRRLELCLLERGKAVASKDFQIFFEMLSTEIYSPYNNSFGKTIGVPKTVSAGERPVSSLGCTRSPGGTQGNSSAQVACEHVSLHHAVLIIYKAMPLVFH